MRPGVGWLRHRNDAWLWTAGSSVFNWVIALAPRAGQIRRSFFSTDITSL